MQRPAKLLFHKKAQTVHEEMLMFLLYISAAVAILFALNLIISSTYQSTIETNNFENKLYAGRMVNFLSQRNQITQRLERDSFEIKEALPFDFENFKMQIALKVSLGEEEKIYNEPFYKHARPLSPVRYNLFQQKIAVGKKELLIEQVYTDRLKGE